MIEARIVNAATSKISVPFGDAESSTKSANSIDATPFGPNQAMNSLLRPRQPGRGGARSGSPTGRATSSAKAMKTTSGQIVAAVADGDDQRAEDEERQHLEDRRSTFSENSTKRRGCRARRRPARSRPRTRRSGRCRRSPRRGRRRRGRSRSRRCPRSGRVIPPPGRWWWSRPPSDAEGDADHGAEGRLAEQLSRLGPGVAAGLARARKKSTKGSARPSLSPDSRLSVWRTIAGTRWEVTTAEVTTGSVGESTAASRNASAQRESVNSACPTRRAARA